MGIMEKKMETIVLGFYSLRYELSLLPSTRQDFNYRDVKRIPPILILVNPRRLYKVLTESLQALQTAKSTPQTLNPKPNLNPRP